MGERLNEVEINEDVTSLHEQNEYDPDRAVVKCFNWTPLHRAASSGQLGVFQELLSRSPELADALDFQGRSLLHLASANGHIGIVKSLIKVRPDMCLARDRGGANPLHVAAMRGKVEVLDELFQANPHAARARVDRGEKETILHLCVKYNQPHFLSILLEKYFKGKEFVNAKDNAGNTILHLAVADRKKKIIEHVLSHTEIDVNVINASKQTAKDILLYGQKKGTKPEGVEKHIQGLLEIHHAKRVKDGIFDPTQIAERKNGIIVAAVLMATLAFQAGVTPPGGVWQDDSDEHKSGEAVMAYNHPFLFWYFSGFNIIGFVASLVTISLIVIEVPFKKRAHWLLIASLMGATIVSIAITYLISLAAVAPGPKPSNRTILRIGGIVTVISVSIIAPFLLCLITRTVCLIARTVRKRKRKRERKNNVVERVDGLSLTNPASVNEANV